MAIGGVVIQFAARTRDAVRDVDKLTRALDRSGREAKSAGSILKSSLKAGIAGVGIAAVGAGIAFVDMAKGALADAQAAAKMQRTLKTIPGITDAAAQSASDFTAKLELLTHVNDDELRPALAKLAVVTEDLADAQKLTALAADAAVGSGRSFESVATAMAKAAGGNVTALKRLFPQLDAGPDKILTFEEAMSQLRDTYAGAAKDAADNDLFGKLALAWAGIKDALGQAALPALEEVSEWFADPKNIDAVQEWIDKVGEWSREVGEKFKGKIEELIDYLGSPAGQKQIEDMQAALLGFADAIRDISDAVSKAGPVIDFLKAINGGNIPQGELDRADRYADELIRRRRNAADAPRAADAARGGGEGPLARGGGGTVNVTINNPKAEPSSTSVAAAIRTAKAAGY
jgi:hypothetical protein